MSGTVVALSSFPRSQTETGLGGAEGQDAVTCLLKGDLKTEPKSALPHVCAGARRPRSGGSQDLVGTSLPGAAAQRRKPRALPRVIVWLKHADPGTNPDDPHLPTAIAALEKATEGGGTSPSPRTEDASE